jgi:hypothetical protein
MARAHPCGGGRICRCNTSGGDQYTRWIWFLKETGQEKKEGLIELLLSIFSEPCIQLTFKQYGISLHETLRLFQLGLA